jgi:hypothetical protein
MTPELIFIVPYRNRAPQKKVFECVMPTILEDEKYKIIFVHQKDNRPFNRGAIKNLGFIYVRKTYPETYKNITLVLHDIDFMPYYKNQFKYKTKQNVVKHFFGYTNTLGGIVSINAGDFEKINGFPNIWSWGLEDNVLKRRCQVAGFVPDRSTFYHGGVDEDKVITLWHGWDRLINPKIKRKFTATTNLDGIKILKNVNYTIEEQSENISVMHVTNFITGESHLVGSQDTKLRNSRENKFFKDGYDGKNQNVNRRQTGLLPVMIIPKRRQRSIFKGL